MNYCENKDFDKMMKGATESRGPFESIDSNIAEIAVIRKNGDFAVGEDGDTVKGHVEIEEWLEVFKWCKEHKG